MQHVLEIARQTFLLQARSKIYWLLILLSVGFACVFFGLPLRAGRVPGNVLFEMIIFMGAFTVVLPFIVLYLAVHAVHGDLEDRTIVYLFTRPVRRVWVLLGKWLAVVALGGVFALVAIGSFYVVIAHSGRPWQNGAVPSFGNFVVFLQAAGLSVAGYAAMGTLFAAFFRRPMLLSMFYIVLQEFASRMPAHAGIHSLTVADPVRRFLAGHLVDPSRGLRHMLGVRMGDGDAVEITFTDPLVSLGKLIAVTLVLAVWIYSRREYDARPRE